MQKICLSVNSLTTTFRTDEGVVHAVNGISFDVNEGETLGIVGESGCGKSVSMLSIMRLLPQPPAKIQAESIRFFDIELTKLSEEEMQHLRGRQMAMVFQDPMTFLNPVLTIGFQLMEPLRVHLNFTEQQARERAEELLQMVGIPEARLRLKDYPHQFSGGMRQRVMIAMALACNPPLVIADEPTTALDVTIQAQIVELVKRLRDEFKMTLIWITHDLAVVAGLANRVIVMYAGHIMEDAPIEMLYAEPLHPYTAALLRALPKLDRVTGSRLETIPGLPPDLIYLPKGCPYAPRCRYKQEICMQQMPPLEKRDGRRIACWVDVHTGRLR